MLALSGICYVNLKWSASYNLDLKFNFRIFNTFQKRARLSCSLKNRTLSLVHKKSIKNSSENKSLMTVSTRQKISRATKGKKKK